MTGFGVGDVTLPEGRVVAEIRSVNQRFLDVRARLPREIADLSLFAEQVARERLRRGRIELVVHTEGALASASVLDRARARAALRALGELRDELAQGGAAVPAEVPLSLLAAVPDLFTPPAGPEQEALRGSVKLAIERAVTAMDAMCRREGEALAVDLRARCGTLRELCASVVRLAEGSRDALRARLRDRVRRLLAEVELPVDAARIETEVVLIAERSDVTEEVTRLGSHLDQFSDVLADDGREPVGRRLDFLLQEMLREANTLGAKAQDASLSHRVVSIKVELERLREQVQNIE
jgi:uncharacterized protein (TIGR00255 family)